MAALLPLLDDAVALAGEALDSPGDADALTRPPSGAAVDAPPTPLTRTHRQAIVRMVADCRADAAALQACIAMR